MTIYKNINDIMHNDYLNSDVQISALRLYTKVNNNVKEQCGNSEKAHKAAMNEVNIMLHRYEGNKQ